MGSKWFGLRGGFGARLASALKLKRDWRLASDQAPRVSASSADRDLVCQGLPRAIRSPLRGDAFSVVRQAMPSPDRSPGASPQEADGRPFRTARALVSAVSSRLRPAPESLVPPPAAVLPPCRRRRCPAAGAGVGAAAGAGGGRRHRRRRSPLLPVAPPVPVVTVAEDELLSWLPKQAIRIVASEAGVAGVGIEEVQDPLLARRAVGDELGIVAALLVAVRCALGWVVERVDVAPARDVALLGGALVAVVLVLRASSSADWISQK